MQIRAIVFDVGGVYLQGSFTEFVNKSRRFLGIEGKFSTDAELVFDPDYNKGKVSVEECFRKYFRVPISDEQMEILVGYWTTTWKLEQNMGELVAGLKRNYSMAILSNSDLTNSTHYAERGWYDIFDVVVQSHEEGILKPDREIFDILLARLHLPPEECVLIDDVLVNVEVARAVGMQGILYRSVGQLMEELSKLGVRLGC